MGHRLGLAGNPVGSLADKLNMGVRAQGLLRVADPSTGAVRYTPGADREALKKLLRAKGIAVVAVRHGQTDLNARGDQGKAVLAGRLEASLTARGEAQAQAAALRLFEHLGGRGWLLQAAADSAKVPALYVSQLRRTQQTAVPFLRLVQGELERLVRRGDTSPRAALTVMEKLAPRVDSRLDEMSYGELEGKPLADATRLRPGLLRTWDAFKSRMDVLERLSSFLHDAAERHPGQQVVLFSHLEAIQAAQVALGSGVQDGLARLRAQVRGIRNGEPQVLVGWAKAVPDRACPGARAVAGARP